MQLESHPHEEIEMIITELMKKDKMWQIERERRLSTSEGERKVKESFRQMYAENQAVLDKMARDEEECRINEEAVTRTKDQDKEYAELDEVLIASEKQGVAEEETQKEKESAQVGNLQLEKDAETSFIQSLELKTLKKESSQEPDKFQSTPEQGEPEFETSHTSQRIGQQQKGSEGQSTRSTEDVEPMEHSPAGAAGSGPSVTPRFPGAQGGIQLSI